MDLALYPNTTAAEGAANALDFTATGFKIRASLGGLNTSAQTYIYMAFAEMPVGAQSRAR